MQNDFYTDFDTELLEGARREDYRTPFQVDRDRIIYTAAFRRLQSKTQVFLSGEYDFYRTRLTHSLEVAQIGRSICQFLCTGSSLLGDGFRIDPDLVEGACLAHDIGHPPFGHAGERTLHRLMAGEYGGFEGNAQSLRILTETIYARPGHRKGMKPTRALLDAILKYKSLHRQLDAPDNHFLYDSQARILDFVFDNADPAAHLEPGNELNRFRSIECQIMDWADDTAYCLNDVVDGANAGFISAGKVERWGENQTLTPRQGRLLEDLVTILHKGKFEPVMGMKIGDFVQACRLEESSNFMSGKTNRYRFRLAVAPEVREEADLYKKIATDLVFRSPQLEQIEHKGDFVLGRLFKVLEDRYIKESTPALHLLPELEESALLAESGRTARARQICDHIAGMTDGFASRTYKRFFDPDFGSIVDLI